MLQRFFCAIFISTHALFLCITHDIALTHTYHVSCVHMCIHTCKFAYSHSCNGEDILLLLYNILPAKPFEVWLH